MASDPAHYQRLLAARTDVVIQLTTLNSQHIQSEARLAGLEIELLACRESMFDDAGKGPSMVEIKRLENETKQVEIYRETLDTERSNLQARLQEFDAQIDLLD